MPCNETDAAPSELQPQEAATPIAATHVEDDDVDMDAAERAALRPSDACVRRASTCPLACSRERRRGASRMHPSKAQQSMTS